MNTNKIKISSIKDIYEFEKLTPNIEKTAPDLVNTYEIFKQSAQKFAKKPALSLMLQGTNIEKLQTFTYEQLFEKINQTANLLNRLGATKDSIVALILPNLAQTHFFLWGGQAQSVIMPINPMLEPEAIANLLKEAKAEFVVTLAPFPKVDIWEKVAKSIDKLTSLRHIILIDLAYQIGGFKGFAAKLLQKKHEYSIYKSKGIESVIPKGVKLHRYDKIIEAENSNSLDSNRVFSSSDYSSFFCTGGTTGLPKIAMRNHKNEVANTLQVMGLFGKNTINSSKTVLSGLPLFHVNAVLATGLYPFMQGSHVILATPQGFRGEGVMANFWDIVSAHKISFFAAVPTVYSALLNNPIKNQNIDSLEFGICGAAPMPVQVFKDFEKLTGIKILEGYGLTEGTCVSSVNPPLGERKIGSVGLRLPTQKLAIIKYDSENTKSMKFELCAPNEKGLVVISGENVFLGYLIDEQNKSIWIKDAEGNKWLNTGDLGYLDEDSYLFLTGRQKEMILRGGHNIDPKSIEEVMHTHPAIAQAAAVGKPDAYAGELPILFVELKPGVNATQAEILDYANTGIYESAAIPKEVHILEELPLTSVGKVFKPELKRKAILATFNEVLKEAKIKAKLEVNTHEFYGFKANIVLDNSLELEKAKKLLGAYAVKFEII